MTYENDNVNVIVSIVNSNYEFPVVYATQISIAAANEIDPQWVENNVIGKGVGVYKLEFINGITRLAIFPTMKLPIEALTKLADSISQSFLFETDDLVQWNYVY